MESKGIYSYSYNFNNDMNNEKKFRITYFIRNAEDGEELDTVFADNWIEDTLAGQYVICIEGIENDDDCIIIPEVSLREIYQVHGLSKDKETFLKRRNELLKKSNRRKEMAYVG